MADGPNASDPWSGLSTGWAVTSYLVSGMLVFGGIGYLLDWLVASDEPFSAFRDVAGGLTTVGVVVGAALAVYLVYLRFGRADG